MKLHQIATAFPALKRLGNTEMSFEDAYKLHKLTTLLQPKYDFYCEQELKIIEKYGGVLDMNSPAVEFPDRKSNIAFKEEQKQLKDMDIEDKITGIKVTVTENMRIPANDITTLTPFVEFIFEK